MICEEKSSVVGVREKIEIWIFMDFVCQESERDIFVYFILFFFFGRESMVEWQVDCRCVRECV